MGIKTFNKAMAILHCDFPRLLFNSFDSGVLTPEMLNHKLVQEVSKLGLWHWDTFNFEIMTVTEAIEIESKQRVIDTPISELSIPIPGVGYNVIRNTSNDYQYDVIVNDYDVNSEFASSIQQKFKMGEPERLVDNDTFWSYFYDLYIT